MNLENNLKAISENVLHLGITEIILKDIEEFDLLYTGTTSPKSDHFDDDSQIGYFENFGKDLLRVEEFVKKNGTARVWTDVDLSIGLVLVPGFYLMDSFRFFISNEEWSNSNEVFLLEAITNDRCLIN